MKESTWKFVILGVAILLWTIVMLYNIPGLLSGNMQFAYRPLLPEPA